jgi:hypothetical protein
MNMKHTLCAFALAVPVVLCLGCTSGPSKGGQVELSLNLPEISEGEMCVVPGRVINRSSGPAVVLGIEGAGASYKWYYRGVGALNYVSDDDIFVENPVAQRATEVSYHRGLLLPGEAADFELEIFADDASAKEITFTLDYLGFSAEELVKHIYVPGAQKNGDVNLSWVHPAPAQIAGRDTGPACFLLPAVEGAFGAAPLKPQSASWQIPVIVHARPFGIDKAIAKLGVSSDAHHFSTSKSAWAVGSCGDTYLVSEADCVRLIGVPYDVFKFADMAGNTVYITIWETEGVKLDLEWLVTKYGKLPFYKCHHLRVPKGEAVAVLGQLAERGFSLSMGDFQLSECVMANAPGK